MKIQPRNLLAPCVGSGEDIVPLVVGESFVLEHIVSRGASSGPGFWYDQPRDEWVMLAQGSATLAFEQGARLTMSAGDAIVIPAHCRHRVDATSADAVWLALHYSPAQTGAF